jgi:Disulphide bond corrector protein DsbC
MSRGTAVWVVLGAFVAPALGSGVRAADEVGDSHVKVTATAGNIDKDGRQTITIKMDIHDDFHVYANPVKYEDLEPAQTVVKISSAKKLEEVTVYYPAGERQSIQKDSYQIYEGNVEILAIVKRAAGDTGPLEVTVRYQKLNDKKGICFLPEAVKLQVK